jgi:hypothetical protein
MVFRIRLLTVVLASFLFVGPARAHVDYVTPGPGAALDAFEFVVAALSDPLTAGLVVGGGLGVAVAASSSRGCYGSRSGFR